MDPVVDSIQGELWVPLPKSTPAVKAKIGKTSRTTGFKTPLKLGLEIRQTLLRPILENLEGHKFKDDEKSGVM